VGTSGDDDLIGTEGPDVVSLGYGDDVFDGLGGDDLVCTSEGKDKVDVGAGNDRVFGDGVPGHDEIRTGDGDDWVMVYGGVISTGPGNDAVAVRAGGAMVHTGPGIDNASISGFGHVWLGAGADNGFLEDGNPVVDGGDGADQFVLWQGGVPEEVESFRGARMIGGAGHDLLRWAMDWPMHLNARTGRVTTQGSVLGTGSENDTEAAFRGIETFMGSGFDDVMIGHRGRDDFQGIWGDDVLIGRGGRDLLVGGPGRDKATGGTGVDTCRAEQRRSCERR
jgi:Ca2+-binding RTX toxin-like protein